MSQSVKGSPVLQKDQTLSNYPFKLGKSSADSTILGDDLCFGGGGGVNRGILRALEGGVGRAIPNSGSDSVPLPAAAFSASGFLGGGTTNPRTPHDCAGHLVETGINVRIGGPGMETPTKTRTHFRPRSFFREALCQCFRS